ncbi:MAG: HD-GYP domain-containing protein [Dechloromonas sp.]|nr:HD-GYP domain-containing protein [Dechloromonas sp.]
MLKKIPVRDVRVGMHLQEFCGAWLDHPFWRSRFVLTDPKDLKLIVESPIREVWIDTSLGLDTEPDAAGDCAPVETVETPRRDPAPLAEPRTSFSNELKSAAKICAMGKEAVASMFLEARMGKAIEADAVAPLVEQISNSMLRNGGALVSLARLKTADNYTYMHSVAVCALMIAVARRLGLDPQQVSDAGMAGLLHDLGKALIPKEILDKPGKLTDAEFAIIKTHPAEGHKLLLAGSGIAEAVKDVCLHHHEKVDGSGYPEGLTGEAMSLLAKMGAVCDVYDAITSNRPYKAGWCPAESIKRMAEWKGHFDPYVFQAFVKSLGIYPVGAFVRLESGRMGVIVEQSESSLLKPKIRVFFSARSQAYIVPETIDLECSPEKIAGREDPEKWGIKDFNHHWLGDNA